MAGLYIASSAICCWILGLQVSAQKLEVCSEYDSRLIKCPKLTFENGIVCYTLRRSPDFRWLWSEATFNCHSSFSLSSNETLKCKYRNVLFSKHYSWYWDRGKPTCDSIVKEILVIPEIFNRNPKTFETHRTSAFSSDASVVSQELPTTLSQRAIPFSSPLHISKSTFVSVSPSESPTLSNMSEASSIIKLPVTITSSSSISPEFRKSKSKKYVDSIFPPLLFIIVTATIAIILTIFVVSFLIVRGRRGKITQHKVLFCTESDEDNELNLITSVTNPFYFGYAPKN